jgi:DNA-binding phage protein
MQEQESSDDCKIYPHLNLSRLSVHLRSHSLEEVSFQHTRIKTTLDVGDFVLTQIDLGEVYFTLSEVVTRKLVKLNKMFDFEVQAIKDMRRFTPRKQHSNVFVLLTKRLRTNEHLMKNEFLSKLNGIKLTSAHHHKAEKLVMEVLITDDLAKMFVAKGRVRRSRSRGQITKKTQLNYKDWRKKKDYQKTQQELLADFLESKDSDKLFLFGRLFLEYLESCNSLKILSRFYGH